MDIEPVLPGKREEEEVVSDHQVTEIVRPVLEPMLPEERKIRHLPVVSKPYRVRSSTATTTTVRTPNPGKKLRVLYAHLTADGAVYAYFRFAKHTQPEARLLPVFLGANSALNANLVGANIEGDPDEALELVTDAAVNVDAMVVVEEVPGLVVAEEDE
jgi:hypothetical protein